MWLDRNRLLRSGTENLLVLSGLIISLEKVGNGLFWLSLEPKGTTVVPVVFTSLIQNSNHTFWFGCKVFETVRRSGSECLSEGFRKVSFWQKNNKKRAK